MFLDNLIITGRNKTRVATIDIKAVILSAPKNIKLIIKEATANAMPTA